MRIYGDEVSTRFKTDAQESGSFWGNNDVLVGDKQTLRRITSNFLGTKDEWVTSK